MGVWGEIAKMAVQFGLQQGGNAMDSRRQFKYQSKLNDDNVRREQQMTDYNLQRQLDLWEKTGYGAQKKQMLSAGLNPGLMYGMGSGGGQTVNVATGNESAGSASAQSTNVPAMAGMAMQLGLLDAQKKNIEADTQLKLADASKTSGVDTEQVKANTLNILQDTKNKEANELLTKAQTNVNNITGYIMESTKEGAINKIFYESRAAQHYMNLARYQDYTVSKTMDDNIKKVHAESLNAIAAVELMGEQIKNIKEDTKKKIAETIKTNQDIQNSIQEIAQGWKALDQKDKEIKAKSLMEKLEIMYKGMNLPLGTQLPLHDIGSFVREMDKIINN